SICVIDREPKALSETARKTLINLALVTARLIELRHALKESNAEAQVLGKSVEQLRQVAENAPVGIFCANHELEWVYANRALMEIVQRDPSDL
ncbi:PAS domain-containing protein, partial [Salmonella enterica]|uniref:PAS domain-containing protein n=1 Tax=Salmonella enterica TaxID=28901 RepID=UPI0032B60CE1